ncbi:hypothetical protein ABTN45_20655, partial [Acinetobacter baumannii]
KGVADDGGSEDPDLVAGQTRPAVEYLEHGVSPRRLFIFISASAAPAHRLYVCKGYRARGANGKPELARGCIRMMGEL